MREGTFAFFEKNAFYNEKTRLETEMSTNLGPSVDELLDDIIVLLEHSGHEGRAPIHGHLGVRMAVEQPLDYGAVPAFCRVVECTPKKGPCASRKSTTGSWPIQLAISIAVTLVCPCGWASFKLPPR